MTKQYIRSERAHFMCPKMYFGIVLKMDVPFLPSKMESSIQILSKAHPFLRAHLSCDKNTKELFYDIEEESFVTVTVCESEAALWEDFEKIGTEGKNLFESGMLSLFVYPTEKSMTVLFAAHHLLTDGMGLASLALEFADLYAEGILPGESEEHLIPGEEALPSGSCLSGISRLLVKYANKNWKKENHSVSYSEYLDFEKSYSKMHPGQYQTYEIEKDELAGIAEECHLHNVTINDWLMSQMYLRTGTQKIIMAADIRKLLPDWNPGSLGNYATAVSVICRSKTDELWKKAEEVHKIIAGIRKNNRQLMTVLSCYFEMDPELLDAAAISALGGFESKAAGFVGKGMFGFGGEGSYSITNLGRFENRNAKSLLFIPPASPAARLTLGVISLNGVLRACSCSSSVLHP